MGKRYRLTTAVGMQRKEVIDARDGRKAEPLGINKMLSAREKESSR